MEVTRQEQSLTLSRTLFNIPFNAGVTEGSDPSLLRKGTLGGRNPTYTLRSHIYNLRRIIDRPFGEPLLQTRQGQGYCLKDFSVEQ